MKRDAQDSRAAELGRRESTSRQMLSTTALGRSNASPAGLTIR